MIYLYILLFSLLTQAKTVDGGSADVSEDGGSVDVGDGGCGLARNGQVYLKDLVWGGTDVHENPFVGSIPHPYGDHLLTSLRNPRFDPVKPLISRKLQDLDDSMPGFGFLVGLAIQKLSWKFLEPDLQVTPDSKDEVLDAEKSGFKYVQLANRYLREVRIHRPSWDKMSESHRAALIIHEAVYSLAPRELKQMSRKAPAIVTRKLVAWSFSEEELKIGMPTEVLRYFGLDRFPNREYREFHEIAKGRFLSSLRLRGYQGGKSKRYFLGGFNGVPTEKEIREKVAGLCKMLVKDFPRVETVKISMLRPSYRLALDGSGFDWATQRTEADFTLYSRKDGDFGDWGNPAQCEEIASGAGEMWIISEYASAPPK